MICDGSEESVFNFSVSLIHIVKKCGLKHKIVSEQKGPKKGIFVMIYKFVTIL